MSKTILMADSSCDLTEEQQKQYDIIVLPGHVTLPDNTDNLVCGKWDFIERDKFYSELKKNPSGFKTSPTNASEYAQAFRKYVSDGDEIIVSTLSSGISGSYSFAIAAKEEVMKEFPNAKIEVVDSLRFGPGFGLMLVYASRLREEGKTTDEILNFLLENRNRFHQAGWLDDLSFVAKKGRMTHAKAFLGTLAGIKVIGEFDYNGLTTVIGKVKGAQTAYKLLMDYISNTIEDAEKQTIFIAQTNRYPQALEYKKMIEETFNPKEVIICDVFPDCGVNVGPGLMTAYYYGKPITKELKFEKEIVNNFLGEQK